MAQTNAREFDIVVYGATGFSGKLLAEYLVKHYSNDVKLAFGGRNQKKLEQVRKDLTRTLPQAAKVPIIIADSGNLQALTEMAKKTSCVASTVGPFAIYGTDLVEACARSGTSYCDITGEADWSATMFNRFEAIAKESGARIVHQAGFDSVPSDMGAMLAARTFRERFDRDAEKIEGFFNLKGGGVQGGTIATVLDGLANSQKHKQLKKQSSKGAPPHPNEGKTKMAWVTGLSWNKSAELWGVPFFMQPCNVPNVRHSNGRLGYSKKLAYSEYMSFNSFVPALFMYLGLIVVGILLVVPPTRWVLKKFVLPAPGQGPSMEQCEKASYTVKFCATAGSDQADVKITAVGDASCISTTCCIAETAMGLTKDAHKLTSPGGVTTTAAALGDVLLSRLNSTPLFTIEATK